MSTTAAVKPARRFPPPCWTRDEALVLIDAYRERWHALHRAFLRNPDWDAVAEKVTTSCPDVTPPKTSAQCRHKMEKLRQRHRAEKQRASSFPGGRFFSSWFYFEAMEALEIEPKSNSEINDKIPISDHQIRNPVRGIRFKPFPVPNLVNLPATSKSHNLDFNSRVPNWSNHTNSLYSDGIRINPSIPSHQRKFSKVVHELHDQEADENGGMWIKVPRNKLLFHQNENCNPDLKQGKKRGNGGYDEVVSSIKLLGDGFMKMEKMKIDMVREIERMRIETEMKRNQLILESQKQIVEVFVKGLVENRKNTQTETMAGSLL